MRWLGRTKWVHFCLSRSGNNGKQHFRNTFHKNRALPISLMRLFYLRPYSKLLTFSLVELIHNYLYWFKTRTHLSEWSKRYVVVKKRKPQSNIHMIFIYTFMSNLYQLGCANFNIVISLLYHNIFIDMKPSLNIFFLCLEAVDFMYSMND